MTRSALRWGGAYDFGVVKPYLSAAYFKDARMKNWMSSYTSGFASSATVTGDGIYSTYLNGDWDGYGVILGASAPLVGGTAHMTIGYMDAEELKSRMILTITVFRLI